MLRAILEDRYGGCYSGGKYLIVDNYYTVLTEHEIALINPHIRDTDEFYNDMCVQYGLKQYDNTLKAGATRLDAVETTLQGSDCYAAWDFTALPWVQAVQTLAEVEAIITAAEELRAEESARYFKKLMDKNEPDATTET